MTIPNGVTKIGKLAFQGCASLTRVTIPASVKVIEANVFDVDIRVGWEYSALENLKDIYYGGTKEQWDAISIDGENETLKTAAIHFNSAAPAFTDVPSWFETEVAWAAQKGVTKGYGGSDTFAPDLVCNRGEIAAFLYRAYSD